MPTSSVPCSRTKPAILSSSMGCAFPSIRITSWQGGVSDRRRNIQRCGIKLRVTPLSGLYKRIFIRAESPFLDPAQEPTRISDGVYDSSHLPGCSLNGVYVTSPRLTVQYCTPPNSPQHPPGPSGRAVRPHIPPTICLLLKNFSLTTQNPPSPILSNY